MNSKQGFTLVELLIATAILTLIITTVTWSYSFFTNNWLKIQGRGFNDIRKGIVLSEIGRVLKATSFFSINTTQNIHGFYFSGLPQSIVAVTGSSLKESQRSAVYRISLFLEEGNWYLKYQEIDLAKFMPSSLDVVPQEFDLEIDVQIEGITPFFSYFGWQQQGRGAIETRNYEFDIRKAQWLPGYNGLTDLSLPAGIKLSYSNHANQIVELVFKLPEMQPERLSFLGSEEG